MAYNKKDQFPEIENRASAFAKVLSHPARIVILKILSSRNVCICGDLVLDMPLSQSTVSQHLKDLKEAGIIKGEIEGAKSCYCINWDVLEKEIENFTTVMEEMKKNAKCC